MINTTRAQAREVLTDFSSMPIWSSNLLGSRGDIENGAQVTVNCKIRDNVFQIFHTLIYYESSGFGWSEEIGGISGINDNHRYIVGRSSGSKTLFIQYGEFKGSNSDC